MQDSDKQALSVTELSNQISRILEQEIGFVIVRGEVSNYKLHTSGHRYFTLKDSGAQISCTVWRTRPIAFNPTDGMEVVVEGNLTVYPPRGQYQIECLTMRKYGMGDLFAKFEELKQKLMSEGLFDSAKKRKIPQLPLRIGIATSATGAAYHDMITTIARRMPLATVLFRPTTVQGDAAAADIVQAIADLNESPCDVIIIGRGGGSIEDLWCFNEEAVARAIFASETPIVSAVGHETDFTISDFTADVRAATPTAAAELVTPITAQELALNITNSADYITRELTDLISTTKSEIDSLATSYGFRRLMDKIMIFSQNIDDLEISLERSIAANLKQISSQIETASTACAILNPLSPLKKGFALLECKGKILKATETLNKYKSARIIRQNESAMVTINSVSFM